MAQPSSRAPISVGEIVRRLGISLPSADAAVAKRLRPGMRRPVDEQRRQRVLHAHEVMNAGHAGLDTVLDDAARAGHVSG